MRSSFPIFREFQKSVDPNSTHLARSRDLTLPTPVSSATFSEHGPRATSHRDRARVVLAPGVVFFGTEKSWLLRNTLESLWDPTHFERLENNRRGHSWLPGSLPMWPLNNVGRFSSFLSWSKRPRMKADERSHRSTNPHAFPKQIHHSSHVPGALALCVGLRVDVLLRSDASAAAHGRRGSRAPTR